MLIIWNEAFARIGSGIFSGNGHKRHKNTKKNPPIVKTRNHATHCVPFVLFVVNAGATGPSPLLPPCRSRLGILQKARSISCWGAPMDALEAARTRPTGTTGQPQGLPLRRGMCRGMPRSPGWASIASRGMMADGHSSATRSESTGVGSGRPGTSQLPHAH